MLKVVPLNPPAKPKRRRIFKPGDEVHVKSDPDVVMTVEESNPDKTSCWWFDEMRDYKCLQFPTVILKRAVFPKEKA